MQVQLGLAPDDAVDRRAQLLLDAHQVLGTLADDDRLLRIAFHVDRHDDLDLAVIGLAGLVVLRVFDRIDHHGQRMRQLVVQLLQERAAHQLGNRVLGALLGDLIGRVHLRSLRHIVDQHVAHLGQIVMLQRAHRHDVGEIGELVDLDELGDQLLTVELVDLGNDGDQRHLPGEAPVVPLGGELGAQPAQDALVARADLLVGR